MSAAAHRDRLDDGKMRGPVAAWVLLDRWKALSEEDRPTDFPVLTPDFVAELRCPKAKLPTLRNKMALDRVHRVRLGGLIDPENRRVEIFRPGRDVEILDDPAAVSGDDVLAGFVLAATRIFDIH